MEEEKRKMALEVERQKALQVNVKVDRDAMDSSMAVADGEDGEDDAVLVEDETDSKVSKAVDAERGSVD